MPKAISNTSPLLYLYRVGTIHWLPQLFEEVWIPLLSLLSFKKDCKGDIMFLLQRPTLGSTLLSLEVHLRSGLLLI
jgi:predicted nucleic acid-binding protein